MPGPKLYFLLNRASQSLLKKTDAIALERVGATSAQLGALFFVAANPGCRQRDLAEMFGQRESAVAGMVVRLENAELLERRPSETDGRAYSLYLSDAGRRVLRRARPMLAELNQALVEGFTPEEIEIVVRFLIAMKDKELPQ